MNIGKKRWGERVKNGVTKKRREQRVKKVVGIDKMVESQKQCVREGKGSENDGEGKKRDERKWRREGWNFKKVIH